MTAPHDLDRQLSAFLAEGPMDLPDQSFDAVRDQIESIHQRVVIGPWRFPDMNKLAAIGLGTAAVVLAVVVGSRLLGPPASGGVGGAPSATPTVTPSPTPVGGRVEYKGDGGAPATTEVNVVVDGASVSGTAVSTSASGTHTVHVECAARDRDTWAFGGTTEQTTLPGESPGSWSAVVVKDGSPQKIGIWLSDSKKAGVDCDGWLAGIGLSDIEAPNFTPVVSGSLVPPPDIAT